MAINPITGLIEWTPASDGNFDVTVEASNSTGTATQSFTVNILNPVIMPGLIAYWPLDEPAGNLYIDVSGNNNGTGNLSPIGTAGQVSGGQLFDGTTTKIEVPASPAFDIAADGDFSVELWYKGDATLGAYQIMAGRFISSGYWYIGLTPNGHVFFNMVNGSGNSTVYGNAVSDGQWHYVTATRNGTTGESKIYVDGSLRQTNVKTFTVDFSSTTTNLCIGSLNNLYLLAGSLDEIAFHNVELTLEEIHQHYTNGLNSLDYYENDAPVITSNQLVNGKVNQLYSYDVDATGYPLPTYVLTTSPEGMAINPITGLIEWTPASDGNFDVTVEASNSTGTATQSFTVNILNPVIMPGLIAYWPLDEPAGNLYIDVSGNNNGTGNLSPIGTAGQVSGGQLFDGTTTKIEIPASPAFDIAADGDFSLELWYKGDATPGAYQIMAGRFISSGYWYIGLTPNGHVFFNMVNGSGNSTVYGNAVSDGQWHYVTATRNGTTGESKIYVDGSLRQTNVKTFTVDFSSTTTNLCIGSLNNLYLLAGSLDEVAFHNVELKPEEIQQHYNNGLSGQGYFETIVPTTESIEAKSAEISIVESEFPQIEMHDLKVYPNPFTDRLRFEFVSPNRLMPVSICTICLDVC
jgi:hypothetical protein